MPITKPSVNDSTANAALRAAAASAVKVNATPLTVSSVSDETAMTFEKSILNSGARPARLSLTPTSPVSAIAVLPEELSITKFNRSTTVAPSAEVNDRPPECEMSPTDVAKSIAPATIGKTATLASSIVPGADAPTVTPSVSSPVVRPSSSVTDVVPSTKITVGSARNWPAKATHNTNASDNCKK